MFHFVVTAVKKTFIKKLCAISKLAVLLLWRFLYHTRFWLAKVAERLLKKFYKFYINFMDWSLQSWRYFGVRKDELRFVRIKVIPGIHKGRLSILINKYHYLGKTFILVFEVTIVISCVKNHRIIISSCNYCCWWMKRVGWRSYGRI